LLLSKGGKVDHIGLWELPAGKKNVPRSWLRQKNRFSMKLGPFDWGKGCPGSPKKIIE